MADRTCQEASSGTGLLDRSMSAADVAAHELASYVRRPRPVAADEHGKTKDPLPQRPRGPHPVGTVAS